MTSRVLDSTIEILEDSDGDGMPNELPDDYDPTNLITWINQDFDDDNDGNSDTDEANDGTDPTNPDIDGDGMCDGPAGALATETVLVQMPHLTHRLIPTLMVMATQIP